MKRIIIIGFILSLISVSCGSKKGVTDESMKNATSKKVLKQFERTQPHFKTLTARMKGTYDDGYQSQSISLSMRIQKDEVIWISAKLAGLIPVSKLMVTPDRVQFYEKLNNQYFDGDFGLISQWLGVEIDFEKLQNLLIGNAIYEIDKNHFELTDLEKGYLLMNAEERFSKSMMLDKITFRMLNQQMISNADRRQILVLYPSYQTNNYFFFPNKIDILVHKDKDQSKINIDFRSLELNQEVKFPFEIPSGYKEIQIK